MNLIGKLRTPRTLFYHHYQKFTPMDVSTGKKLPRLFYFTSLKYFLKQSQNPGWHFPAPRCHRQRREPVLPALGNPNHCPKPPHSNASNARSCQEDALKTRHTPFSRRAPQFDPNQMSISSKEECPVYNQTKSN